MKKILFIIIFILNLDYQIERPIANILKDNTHISTKNRRIPIKKYLGKRYEWGGNGPNSYDCSALAQVIYRDFYKLQIPRTSDIQARIGKNVHIDSLEIGDLLFYKNKLNKIGHTSIYIGNRKIIQAVSRGVVIDSIGDYIWKHYYKNRFLFAKRILS